MIYSPDVSIYIAETVSTDKRGSLGCVPALLHAAGVLAGYTLGAVLAWPHLSLVCAAPGLLLLVSMILMVESPAHLARVGDIKAAVESLTWLRGVSSEAARSCNKSPVFSKV